MAQAPQRIEAVSAKTEAQQRRPTSSTGLRVLCFSGLLLMGGMMVISEGWNTTSTPQVLEGRAWWELRAKASAQSSTMMQSLAGLHGGSGVPLSLRSLLMRSVASDQESEADKVADMSSKIKRAVQHNLATVVTERRRSECLFTLIMLVSLISLTALDMLNPQLRRWRTSATSNKDGGISVREEKGMRILKSE